MQLIQWNYSALHRFNGSNEVSMGYAYSLKYLNCHFNKKLKHEREIPKNS